jgi:hypothetical protein
MYRLRRYLREPVDSGFLVAKRGHGYGFLPEAIRERPMRVTDIESVG